MQLLWVEVVMIDYEKLEEAHELAQKYGKEVAINLEVSLTCNRFGQYNEYSICLECDVVFFKTESIDELIDKLRGLNAKATNKYKEGQTVWRLNDEYRPQEMVICSVDLDSEEMYLDEQDASWWVEEQLYPTRDDLIIAQLRYWSGIATDDEYCNVSGVKLGKRDNE